MIAARASIPAPREPAPPIVGRLIDGADDPLMTAGEVALLLRVTTAWVYAQTRANHIPHVQLGRYVRYRHSAVLGWLEEMERGAGGDSRLRKVV